MKQKTVSQRWIPSVLSGLILACSAGAAMAQAQDIMVNTFANSSSLNSWNGQWWGSATGTYSWDGGQDAQGNSGSGAVHFAIGWVSNTGNDNEYVAYCSIDPTDQSGWLGNPAIVIDATLYASLEFDLKTDTTNSISSGGNYGSLSCFLATSSYGQVYINQSTAFPSDSNWHHVKMLIDPSIAGLSSIGGVAFQSGYTFQSGSTAFWVDNLQFVARVTPPPPVSMSITPVAAPGLRLATSIGDGNGTRQSIYCKQAASWYNASGPVTYSVTITNYPGISNPFYQAQIFLCSGQVNGQADSSTDWNSTNTVFAQIQNGTNGAGLLTFMYKTNWPGSLGSWGNQIFGTNTLCSLPATSMLGTYSITFTDNTNVFISVPGATTNITFPSDSAALFADPMYAYFGIMPNNTNNVTNLTATVANVSITNVTDGIAISDNFTAPTLNTSTWGLAAGDAAGIWIVPTDALFYVNWTLPANKFALYAISDIGKGTSISNWFPTGIAPILFNGVGWNIITKSFINQCVQNGSLTSSNCAFFQAAIPTPTQLQVLLPGETNAPNTPTGKTGSPTPISLGDSSGLVNVTVNAVDSHFNILSSTDVIQLSSTTDPTSTDPLATAMVNGTVIQVIQFDSTGNQTVTATDTTNSNLPPATSSAILVNP